MTRGVLGRLAPGAGAVAAAAVLAGCGLNESGDNLVNGKQQFVAKCGSCHVLQRANTKGVVGPNLDQAFSRAREDGFGESTFKGLVYAQIQDPPRTRQVDPANGKLLPLMPGDLVGGEDAKDVAAYVATAVGKPGKDTGALARVGGGQARGTVKAENGVIENPADPNGGLFYRFANAEAPAGQLTLRSKNDSSVDHDISLEGNGVNEKGPVVKDGGVSELSVDLQPGEYTFYCSVTGHREAGMEGPLVVK
jgi:plastocyanin